MSSSILEKLKVKPIPKKIEQIQVKIVDPKKEEAVEIKTKIIDKTKDKLINRDDFIKKLKVSVSTKVPEVIFHLMLFLFLKNLKKLEKN